jgi:hypothetical protein
MTRIMTVQHWQELVSTVQITTGATDDKMAEILLISKKTYQRWKRGLPGNKRVHTSCKRLRTFMKEALA